MKKICCIIALLCFGTLSTTSAHEKSLQPLPTIQEEPISIQEEPLSIQEEPVSIHEEAIQDDLVYRGEEYKLHDLVYRGEEITIIKLSENEAE